jgi:hypothetical protein
MHRYYALVNTGAKLSRNMFHGWREFSAKVAR